MLKGAVLNDSADPAHFVKVRRVSVNRVNDFLMWSAEYNQNDMYVSDALNVWITWIAMLLLALICVIIAIISLESIDKDKR